MFDDPKDASMDFDKLMRALRKGWLLIIAGAALGASTGVAISLLSTPTYKASTDVYVSVSGSTNSSELAQGGDAAEQRVQSFANLATKHRVLQPVVDRLGLEMSAEELAEKVSAQTPIDSVIVTITVVDSSADQAAAIANATGESLAEVVTKQLEAPSRDGASPFELETVQPAIPPARPASPRLTVDLTGGLAVGLMVGLGSAALRSALDTRLDGRESVERAAAAPALGEIAFDRSAKDRPLVVQDDPRSPRSEAFRRLRTNLQFVEVDSKRRSFVVTSSVPSEGKSTTAANLALALAENDTSIVLVDGDLRRPRVASLMGLEGGAGMTDVLIGRMELDDALQPCGKKGLVVLPAGQIPPNPTELVASIAMAAVLQDLEQRFDVVLIDAPPLLPVTDAAILSQLSGGAILVAAVGRTTRNQLETARATLRDAGTKAVGSVLTMVKKSPTAATTYDYQTVETGQQETRSSRGAAQARLRPRPSAR